MQTARQVDRAERRAIAAALAADHCGVVHREQLRANRIDRFAVRTEVKAGIWTALGRHTVLIGSRPQLSNQPTATLGTKQLRDAGLHETALHWWAVWESGWGAVLTGVTALQAQGLTGFTTDDLHVALPQAARAHTHPGVIRHRPRALDPVISAGVPRVRPEWATIRAAQWAVSDRQSALLIALATQQRIVTPDRLLATWRRITAPSPRRALLHAVINDVCDGAHSLGELDFARWCRRYGLPQPSRQNVRHTSTGRLYLDAYFEGGVVVEIDGAQHIQGLAWTDDALRSNELALRGDRVLRIPVLGLRVAPERFMRQLATALTSHAGMSNERYTARSA